LVFLKANKLKNKLNKLIDKFKDKKIGIALSGGGVRGFAHLGVLKALEEKGIKPDIISGTSAGAIVGSFIAAGKTPEEVLEIMKNNSFYDYANVTVPKKGLLNLDNLNENLEKNLGTRNFSDLKLPFYAAAANIFSAEVKYFNQGDLIKIIQASSSIPVLFSPIEIDGELYVDGGLLDNLPITPIRDKCDILIAVNVMPINKIDEVESLIDMAVRTFQLSINKENVVLGRDVDLLIEPDGLDDYHILNTKYADEIYQIGYNHCRKMDISRIVK